MILIVPGIMVFVILDHPFLGFATKISPSLSGVAPLMETPLRQVLAMDQGV